MAVFGRQARISRTAMATAAAVVLIHAGLVYALLLPMLVPQIEPPAPAILRIVPRQRISPPMPPALFTALAAPAAPFIPPPEIRVQRTVLHVQTVTRRNDDALTGFSRTPGTGVAVRGGIVVPPSPPVYVGEDAPSYPDMYRNTGLRASVSVVCTVQPDGRTTDCNLVNVRGAAAFGKTVLAWLRSGPVRYRPGTRDGHSVAQAAALKFVFSPTGTGVE